MAVFVAAAACTSGSPQKDNQSPSALHIEATYSATAGPAGRRTRPFLDSCRHARPIIGHVPGPRDLAVGPLSYAGLLDFAAPPRVPNWHGGYFYKSGAQLPAGVTATVRIIQPAARYAVLVTESGPDTGVGAVTYRACGSSQAAGYWWVGGFVLRGRRTACVPIEVIAGGESRPRHAIVPLGVPSCR